MKKQNKLMLVKKAVMGFLPFYLFTVNCFGSRGCHLLARRETGGDCQ